MELPALTMKINAYVDSDRLDCFYIFNAAPIQGQLQIKLILSAGNIRSI
jgi:hypothetical protein